MSTRTPSAASHAAPTRERIDLAASLLLTPFGLDESHLARALAEIRAHRVDDADLYFQTTRSEGWSLEEGIVKTGSFSIDQGVGVRAVSGEKTAFAYSDDISEASLLDAARTVRSISAAAQDGRTRVASKKIAKSRSLYSGVDPIGTLGSADKVALLERAEQRARAKDPRVAQVMAGLASEYDVVLVARADGTLAADIRPLVRLSVTVIAEQNGRREMGSAGGGGRFGLAYFDDAQIAQYVDEAVNAALVNLESRPAPAGEMTCLAQAGLASCCTRPSATGWKATSTARDRAPSAVALVSAWRPRASRCSTMAHCLTGAARSTWTTRATPAGAMC